MSGVRFAQNVFPLGFGCAALGGNDKTAHSLRLLETAYDEGIRYFDTARMYMSGEAEGILGSFMRARRGDFVVTSKAGILPPGRGAFQRQVQQTTDRLRLALGKKLRWERHFRFGVFHPRSLRTSVTTSLRELKTDHLDALLLHEADERDLADGRVMELLEELQSAGMIGTYGIASTRAQTKRLVAHYGARFPIVQTASTVLEDGLAPLGDRRGFVSITHSILAQALERIVMRLADDAALRGRWEAQTGTDPSNSEAVAALLLAEALDANQGGIVLFSSSSPARIRAAARIARERPFDAEQIAGLRRLATQFNEQGPGPK